MIGISFSTQIFIGEKVSHTLNSILSSPIKVAHIIYGKWLTSVLIITFFSLILFLLKWFVFTIIIIFFPILTYDTVPLFPGNFGYYVQMVLISIIACWSGAFTWLFFETYQTANIFSLIFSMFLIAIEYMIIGNNISLYITIPALLFANLIIGIIAVKINNINRLSQLV